MFNRKFRRRTQRRTQRPASRPAAESTTAGTINVRVRLIEPGAAGGAQDEFCGDAAAGLPQVLFESMPMRDTPFQAVRQWIGTYADGDWAVTACACCGARTEARLRALREAIPWRAPDSEEAFIEAVRRDTDRMAGFRAAHAACEMSYDSAGIAAVSGHTASPWGLPASLPASVRRWTDEALTLAWAAADKFSGMMCVLLRRASGAEERHALTFDHRPVPDVGDSLPAQLRAGLDNLMAAGDRVVAVAVSMYRLGTSGTSEARVARALCLANEAGVFVGRVGADGHAPVAHHGCTCAEPGAPVPQWFAAAAPSPLFDGLISAS